MYLTECCMCGLTCTCTCSLNYDEKVCCGFYDIWGEFPEATPDGHTFPSLASLKKLPGRNDDSREVCFMLSSLRILHMVTLSLRLVCYDYVRWCLWTMMRILSCLLWWMLLQRPLLASVTEMMVSVLAFRYTSLLRAADMCCKHMLAFCQFHARCKTAPLLLTCISNSNMHWHSCTIPDLSVAHKLPLALQLCALPLHVHTHTLRISSCRYFPCFALMSMVTVSCSLQCCKPLNQNQANRITCRPWLA